jgi:hypothetical protein
MLLKASFVLVIAVAIATLVPASFAIAGLGPQLPGGQSATVGFYNNADSSIIDARGDATPVLQQSNSSTVPEVRGYHDILGASVKKQGNAFLFSIELAGDPNLNEKYETNYLWHVITTSPEMDGDQRHYIIMFPNFAQDSNFAEKGWHYAVFDSTTGEYLVPQTQISSGMPQDRVEFPLEGWLIGNPSSFRYWVTVSARVDSVNLDKPPDYLMDYAP